MLHGAPCTRPGVSGQRPVRSSTLARTDDGQYHGEQRGAAAKQRKEARSSGQQGRVIRLVGAHAGRTPAGSYGLGRVRNRRVVTRPGFSCPAS